MFKLVNLLLESVQPQLDVVNRVRQIVLLTRLDLRINGSLIFDVLRVPSAHEIYRQLLSN